MSRLALLSLLLSTSIVCLAAPVKIHNLSPELALEIQARTVGNRNIVVTVTNREAVAVRCRIEIRNGPQTVRVRKGILESQQHRNFTHKMYRTVNQPAVSVACQYLETALSSSASN